MPGETNYDTSVLRLQDLDGQYQQATKDYDLARANYIQILQQDDMNEMTVIDKRSFTGDTRLSSSLVDDLESCSAKCSTDDTCTGATFNTETTMCLTYSGEGGIESIDSTKKKAILSNLNYALLQMKYYNDLLISLSGEIQLVLEDAEEAVNDKLEDKDEQGIKLRHKYDKLIKERDEIDEIVYDYNSLSQEYKNKTVIVKQGNSVYIVLMLITVLLVFVTMKQLLYPEMESNIVRVVFWFVLLSIFIINVFQMSTVTGFFIGGLIVLAIVLILLNILPSP